MRAGERFRIDTLRLLRAAMLDLQKTGKQIGPDDELKSLLIQAKRRKEAIEEYRKAGRPERAELEEAELRIIEEYLPRQLDADEVRAVVAGVVAQTGASGPGDFKIVMPKAMAALKGQADGALVQQIVRELLEGSAA